MQNNSTSRYGLWLAANLLATAAAIAPAYAGGRTISIINGTRTAMVALQVRPANGGLQSDLLTRRSLGIQKQIGFPVPDGKSCFYDLKATFEDGHRVTRQHVDLCKSQTYLLTDF